MTKIEVSHDGWIVRHRRPRRPRARLFCFAFAGGNSSVFGEWSSHLPYDVEVCAIELPGRLRRQAEEPLRSLPATIAALTPALEPYLDVPVAVFGNCSGSLLAFELARWLDAGHSDFVGLFVSSSRAPHLPDVNPPLSQLPDSELVRVLEALSATPSEILKHEGIIRLLVPTLRADFQLAEEYVFCPGSPLTRPVSAFVGLDDATIGCDQIEAWSEHTAAGYSLRTLSGGHHLIQTSAISLMSGIEEDLTRWVSAVGPL